jgi:RHS repeat-associated protein
MITTLLNSRFLKAFALLTLVFVSGTLLAVKETRNARLSGTALTTGATLQSSDDKFTGLIGWNTGFSLKGSVAKVEFGLNEDMHLVHAVPVCAILTFDVDLTDANLVTTSYTGLQLSIDYDPGALTKYTDKAQLTWNNYYQVEVKNISVSMKTSGCTAIIAKTNDLYVEAEISSEKEYDFGVGLSQFTTVDYEHSYIAADNELEVHWDFIPGAEEYELEWTYVDNYLLNDPVTPKSAALINYDLEHDATRVITSNQYYRIPLTYERGYIVYRLRPIGRNLSGERLEGLWTAISPQNPVGTLSTAMAANRDCYMTNALTNLDINWSSSKTFCENGRQGIGVQYMDGLLKNRQSIARLNTEDKSMVQSNLFDFQGRSTISMLPSPITGKTFDYNFGLNKYNTGTPVIFDKDIFDVCSESCIPQSFRLDSVNSAGSAKYYSSSSADQDGLNGYTPSAHGIPYTQVRFSNDPLNRITKSTMPGLTHAFGSTHEMQYYYVDADMNRLIRLFGPEVGTANHYWKRITIDQNGQASAAYIDMYGRTIATGLMGNAPVGMDTLPDMTPPLVSIQDLSQSNSVDSISRCITLSTTFYVSSAGEEQSFSYSTVMGIFMPDSCFNTGCFDCAYDLDISITDDCGQEFFDADNDPETPGEELSIQIGAQPPYNAHECEVVNNSRASSIVLTSLYSLPGTPITITFPHSGVYTITKRLCVSEAPLASYIQQIEDNQDCVSRCGIIDSLMALADFSGCGIDCEDCNASMEAYQSNALVANDPEHPPLTQSEIDEILTRCALLCPDQLSPCEKYKRTMMLDFKPGGRMASLDPASASYAYSIFNPANAVNWQNPPGVSAGSPTGVSNYYKNTAGTYASVVLYGVSYRPEELPTEADFINNYSDSWGEAFLSIHPDYCKYMFFCNEIAGSWDYDQDMMAIDNYADACVAGFIEPLSTGFTYGPIAPCTGIGNYDPLFQVPLVSAIDPTDLGNFNTEINSIAGSGNGIYLYSSLSALSILSSPASLGTHTFGDDLCFQDAEWIQFRTLYLMNKIKLYKNMYLNFVKKHDCPEVPQGFASIFSFGINDLVSVFGINNSGTPVTDISQINTGTTYTLNITTQCDANCHAYATLWAQDLSGYCPGYTSLSPTDQADLIRDLTAVCMAGCDVSHPDGSSTIATGGSPYIIPGSMGYSCSSFQDVLDYYLTPAGSCSSVSAISTPLSYTATSLTTTYNLKDCGCDKLLGVDYDFTGGVYILPTGVTTGRKLFKYRYGFDLTNYNFLVCACKSALSGSWTPGYTWSGTELSTLSGFNYPVAPQLSCSACISCSDVSGAVGTVQTEVGAAVTDHSFFSANAQAILNNLNQFGETGMDIYQVEDLFNNCHDAHVNGNNPMLVSNSLLNPIAHDLENALSGWAASNLLAVSHHMTLCDDPNYFLSNLYSGDLPNVSFLNYFTFITGDQLTIQISDASSTVICSYVLTLPAGSGLSWSDITEISNLRGYAVTPGTGGLAYTFIVDVSDGTTTVEATGSSCWSLFTISSSLEPMYCPQEPLVNPNQCRIDIINGVITQGTLLYQQQYDELIATFTNGFLDYCFESLEENFTREYGEKEYHYTLYYYDQAGDLVRTVAPKGATVNGAASVYPDHADFSTPTDPLYKQYVTRHKYNSFGSPLNSENPDGGITTYFYDRLGRIVASQNSQQATLGAYSYSFYDYMGRISQVGEVRGTTPSVLTDAISSSPAFNSFMSSGTKSDVIITLYDDQSTPPAAYAEFTGGNPQNLRNRVAGNLFYEKYPSVSPQLNFATWYSYDEYGNVNEIIQENAEVSHMTSLHYKKVQYEYELVSGNAIKIIFQPGQTDQMLHQYYYDEDNRLKEVYTSTDNVNWEKDAKYFYYQHGPLARTEKGDKKVDASDYYYTIQGWIKGVNANNIGANTDPGKDGNNLSAYSSSITGLHAWIARDASAYSINYYSTATENDYDAIKTFNTGTTATNLAGDYDPIADVSNLPIGTSLFNGNITGMITTIKNMGQNVTPATQRSLPMVSRYRYDQLQQLKKSSSFYSINEGTNTWNTPTALNMDNSYLTKLTYDPNGNILTFSRNGAASTTVSGSTLNMDNMKYEYEEMTFSLNPFPGRNRNRLSRVNDAVPAANYTNVDIDDQGSSSINYEYNPTGSLEHDPTQAIDYIEWTYDKKVRKVIRSISQLFALNKNLSDLEFEYDANRRRVVKIEKPRNKITHILFPQENWLYTYYVYDAGGNVMATYQRSVQPYSGPGAYDFTDLCVLLEQDLYGSNRLGLKNNFSLPPFELRDIAVTPSSITETFVHTYSGSSFNYTQNTFDITGVNPYNPPPSPDPYVTTKRELGNKQFEFTNHLGNVLTTVSDRKVPTFSGSIVDYYTADVINTNDYYAFGQLMPGRGYSAGDYRYGFNGKEKDSEMTNVDGSSLDFGLRMYDPRLGRFASADPFEVIAPQHSTYSFAGNSPIEFIDLNGGFQFKPEDEGKYPQLRKVATALSNYVNRAGASVNDPLIQQFILWSGIAARTQDPVLQLQMVQSLLTDGFGPTISVERIRGGAAGAVDIPPTQTPISSSQQFVKIHKRLVRQLETNKRRWWSINKMTPSQYVADEIAIFICLWHEGIHYMDLMLDGIAQDYNYQTQQTNNIDIGDQASQNVFGNGGTGSLDIPSIAWELENDTYTGGAGVFGANDRMGINLFFINAVEVKRPRPVKEICPAYEPGRGEAKDQRSN